MAKKVIKLSQDKLQTIVSESVRRIVSESLDNGIESLTDEEKVELIEYIIGCNNYGCHEIDDGVMLKYFNSTYDEDNPISVFAEEYEVQVHVTYDVEYKINRGWKTNDYDLPSEPNTFETTNVGFDIALCQFSPVEREIDCTGLKDWNWHDFITEEEANDLARESVSNYDENSEYWSARDYDALEESRKVIKLNETQLRNIINESVKRILDEETGFKFRKGDEVTLTMGGVDFSNCKIVDCYANQEKNRNEYTIMWPNGQKINGVPEEAIVLLEPDKK